MGMGDLSVSSALSAPTHSIQHESPVRIHGLLDGLPRICRPSHDFGSRPQSRQRRHPLGSFGRKLCLLGSGRTRLRRCFPCCSFLRVSRLFPPPTLSTLFPLLPSLLKHPNS